ncbi:hypothetical protein DEO72_LG10g1817 [Vigna unguiculata]|uniref:Nucleic acid-binding n=1 Tax=Vigna unguiculata TaxID=3917 RepID=A0A4D6NF72_VIGUN|nr:hypothetical protein DEO72_LG10g1817 [Vigna unguiculata]
MLSFVDKVSIQNFSLEDDFIKLHPRSSIEGLKDFKQATIKHVLDHDDWWYTACICNKAASAMLKKSCSDILDLPDKNTVVRDLPKEFEVLIDKTYLFKVECKNDYNSKFEQSFSVKKVCMDEKVIECFFDVEIKSLDLYSANEQESKVNERTNQIAYDSIAEDLLIKFTEESNDVETLSDHLNNIVSSHVPAKESLKNKDVIDVEIDYLTRKESSHLDNLDLATQPPVPAIKRQSRSMVEENKKIPMKMLKKNIKIEK